MSLAPFGQQPRYRTALQSAVSTILEPASHGDGTWEDRGGRERGDDGRTYTLLTSGDAGATGGSRLYWQMNTHRGAMAQLTIDLNLAFMIINDSVHSR
jgi:hypothetical protein